MFKLLLIIAFISSSNQKLSGKIINGQNAGNTEFPYQLSLRYHDQHICGASIISNQWGISAAHCVTRNMIRRTPDDITLRAGSLYYASKGTIITLKSIYVHSQFNVSTFLNYDMSLLRFNKTLTLSETIAPIALPDKNYQVLPGTQAVCTGWGYTKYKGNFSEILQDVLLNIVDNKSCGDNYKQYSKVTDLMICTYLVNKDACQGDSGGPLVQNKTLIGLVSWGQGCATENPGVFTNVAKMRSYIQDVTGL